MFAFGSCSEIFIKIHYIPIVLSFYPAVFNFCMSCSLLAALTKVPGKISTTSFEIYLGAPKDDDK